MKKSHAALVGAFLLAGSSALLAQDPVKVDPTHYKVILENAAVRVLRASYPVGAKSPMHQHPDVIVVALGPSKARFTMPDKTTQERDLANESGMYNTAGSHSVENIGKTGMDVIVIELKGAAGKAALPASRAGLTLKPIAEGARASAYRATADPTFAEPPGTKHDFDQVVIALGASGMSLSIDGKPAKTTWARGDVQFIGRGVPHEGKNTGGKPADLIIVAIK
jgi:quercetin dioxygenase-like cupin family protein